MGKITTNVQMPKQLWAEAEAQAKREGESLAPLMRRALRLYLEKVKGD